MKRLIGLLFLVAMGTLVQVPRSGWPEPGESKRGLAVPLVEVQPEQTGMKEQSFGVFIGVDHFDDPTVMPLRFCAADAREVRDCFAIDLGYVPPGNTRLLVTGGEGEEKPSYTNMVKAIRWAADFAGPEGCVVVQISTHGIEGYVLAEDSERRTLDATAVSLDWIERTLLKSRSKRRLLIFDACREKMSQEGERAVGGTMSDSFATAFSKAQGFLTLKSCSSGQFSYEMDETGHGAFTHFLLQGLRGGAPANPDGLITVGSLGPWVRRQVEEWSQKKSGGIQSPLYSFEEATGDLPLAMSRAHLDSKALKQRDERKRLLAKMYSEEKLTTDQFKLAESALDSGSQASEKVVVDLLAGKIVPEYLSKLLEGEVKIPTPVPSGTGSFDTTRTLSIAKSQLVPEKLPAVSPFEVNKIEEIKRQLRERKDLLPWEKEKLCASLAINDATAPENVRKIQDFLDGKIGLVKLRELLNIQTNPREQLKSAMKLFIGSVDVEVDVDQAKNQFMDTWDSDDPVCKGWEAWLKFGGLCEISKDIAGASRTAKEVLPELEMLAATDVEAQFILAQLYDEGIGLFQMMDSSGHFIPENLGLTKEYKDKARRLMRKAANNGHWFAKHMLGRYLEKRPGYDPTERDDKEAFENYKELAEQGMTWSMYRLGMCYLMGKGTAPDKDRAFMEFDRAFKKGNYHTRVLLAKMFFEGVPSATDTNKMILEPDPVKGLQCLREAAENEYTPAMVQLADLLLKQEGGKNDAGGAEGVKEAVDLLRIASRKGNSEAQVKYAGIILDHTPEMAFNYIRSQTAIKTDEELRVFLLDAMRLGNPKAEGLFKRFEKENPKADSRLDK